MSLAARTYTDIDLDFEMHPVTRDIAKKKDVQAVVASMKNLIQTNHYERLFQPNIGSNLNRLLFEQMDDLVAVQLKDEIELTIKNFEPRVNIEGIDVVPDYDAQTYEVTIVFFLVNSAEPITVTLFLERVR